jgi:hypothetical protein
MTTQSNIGKLIKLGRRVYAIGQESTRFTHPAIFRHHECKYSFGVRGVKGAYGGVMVWDTKHGQQARVIWLSGNRTENHVGPAGTFEPYEPTTEAEKALVAEVVAELAV